MTDIEVWKKRLRAAQAYTIEYGNMDEWKLNKQYYRNKFSAEYPYNLIFSMARVIIPNTYFRNPHVNVTPTYKPQLYWHAKLVENIDNYLMGRIGLKNTMKRCILDAYLCSTGWCKLGYDSQYGFVKEEVDEHLGDATLTQMDSKAERIEYNVNVSPGMPWAMRVSPECILVPFGTTSIEDCEWIAHVVIRSLDDVKRDPKYVHTKELEGTHIDLLKKTSHYDLYKSISNDRELIELIEIRDFKTREIKVLCMESDKWLREPEEDILQIQGLPFVTLAWNEDPDYIWGLPDATLIAPQQKEMNETRDLIRSHRRMCKMKALVDTGVLSEEEVQKMEEGDVGTFIRGHNVSPNTVIPFTSTIPGDLAAWLNIIREDVRELTGFSRVQMGEYEPTGRRTRGEALLVAQANTIRLDEKRDCIADFLVKILKKINQIIFSCWSGERVVRMVGQDGLVYWVQYTPSAIKGDYDLKVDVESMIPMTKALRKQEMFEVLQLVGKNPQVDIQYLIRLLAKEYDWLDIMQLFPQASQPMPLQQFIQQQQALSPTEIGRRRGATLPMVGGRLR
jgi:hypothetical protein